MIGRRRADMNEISGGKDPKSSLENSGRTQSFPPVTSSIANSINRNYSDAACLYTCIRTAERRALCVVSHEM